MIPINKIDKIDRKANSSFEKIRRWIKFVKACIKPASSLDEFDEFYIRVSEGINRKVENLCRYSLLGILWKKERREKRAYERSSFFFFFFHPDERIEGKL